MNIQEFFTKLYYDNDLLAMTGVNCYDYAKGEVDIESVLQAISDNNIEVVCKHNY